MMARKRVRHPERLKVIEADVLDGHAIGARIAQSRKKRDWRQVDLAIVAGIGHGSLVAYENGLRIPNTQGLARLSRALRRKVDWIIFGPHRVLWRGERRVKESSPYWGGVGD
jgi:transcriptional regulator with XRE-family HTH domain